MISAGHALETLAEITDVVFDKTGTLTEGKLVVQRMLLHSGIDEAQAVAVAQALERQSEHPIARAILNLPVSEGVNIRSEQRINRVGHGVSARLSVGGQESVWAIGRPEFVAEIAGELPAVWQQAVHEGSVIALGNQQGFAALFVLQDQVKEGVADMLAKLRQAGLRLHLLSGDRQSAVSALAESLGLDAARAEATPEDKLAYVETLQRQGAKVLMVGDGINDAPVLAAAEVSMAVAGGADVAREGADVVLLNDSLSVVPMTLAQARRTHIIIRENLIWSTVYNLIAVPLAAAGFVNPWVAVVGMSLSSLLVVANALRLRK